MALTYVELRDSSGVKEKSLQDKEFSPQHYARTAEQGLKRLMNVSMTPKHLTDPKYGPSTKMNMESITILPVIKNGQAVWGGDMSNTPYTRALMAQNKAAHPLTHAFVSANAGSGKTRVLIDRVARLLLKGAAPDRLICVTYTRAAASEMLARLFQRLGSWSIMKDEDLYQELSQLEDSAEHDITPQAWRGRGACLQEPLKPRGN